MKTKDFYFDLPDELIAQHPSAKRGDDKLMILDRFSGKTQNVTMQNLPDFIEPGTLMIFNNSRVRRSRCYAQKIAPAPGEKGYMKGQQVAKKPVEFMILSHISQGQGDSKIENHKGFTQQDTPIIWKCMVKNAKKQHTGNRYKFSTGTIGTIVDHAEFEGTEFKAVVFNEILNEEWFEKNGHIPLPPYIKREDTEEDSERYQNVYANQTGSAACPTAGLHFTPEMMQRLKAKNIQIDFVTLHVGLGTFLPVRAENIEDHAMHEEVYTITEETVQKIYKAKQEGRKVLAVGTTSVRTLESAWKPKTAENTTSLTTKGEQLNSGYLESGTHSTSIFIYPGKEFHVIDQMFTNFHTPESTLLMLVSAFAGKDNIMNAYNEAIKMQYRFFSYGDAMFIK
ncbi:MAG: tRNA preQ1(34) S-adenosylmethionine ribosyltransferase-isomerase QueA [Treponema sp. CETP13]|nr:MAG: tRNA preQ1(34) S-adenosylmethionine ribosyltransferase-isomerase QueA [Treponema sp. CETP13]